MAALVLFAATETQAVVWTNSWAVGTSTAGRTNWSSSAIWVGGVVPGSSAGDTITFTVPANNATITNDYGPVTLGGMNFMAKPGKNYIIQKDVNSYGFTFNNNGNGASLANDTNETVGILSIFNPITLADNLFITNNASGAGNISLSGSIGQSGGSRSLNIYSTVATNGGVTLLASNSYSGATAIGAGILSLGSSGSISNTRQISIAADATFNVTNRASGFTFTGAGPQQTLAGSSTTGTAAIAAGTGAKAVTLASGALLSFQAAGGAGTTAGKISVAGDLNLSSNTITVNVTGSALAAGSYRLMDCTGPLTGSANATPTITGTVLSSGYTAAVSTTAGAGGHVDLVVKATPVFSGLSIKAITNGTASVILRGNVSSIGGSTPVYPANGDTVNATINGHTVAGTVTNYAGAFSINYNDASLATCGVGVYTITYAYAGNSSQFINAATNDTSTTLTVSQGSVPATVTLTNLVQSYDGTAKPVTAITVPAGLTVNITYDGSASAPTNAGSFTVVGIINDGNFHGGATNTLVIGKGTATVTLGDLSQIYDGKAKPVTAITSPGGLTVNLTYNGSTSAPTNTGSYTVVGMVDSTNYQGSTTNTLIITLASPGGMTATSIGKAVNLSWNAVYGATTYNIKRATVSGGPYTTIQSGIAATIFTDNTADYQTTYYYVVCGVDSAGAGNNSTEVSVTPIAIKINSISLDSTNLGPRIVSINISDSLGLTDVTNVTVDVIALFTNTQAYTPIDPYLHRNEVAVLNQISSSTGGTWQVGIYSLQATNIIMVRAYDRTSSVCVASNTVVLSPGTGTYVTVAGHKIFDLVDPHSVWRDIVRNQVPLSGDSVGLNGYCWRLVWQPTYISCYGNSFADTNYVALPPENPDTNNVGLDISGKIAVQLHAAVFVGGSELTGTISRYMGRTNTLFGIQPMYEVQTASGRLVWWVRNLTGDSVLRFGATFYASNSITFTPTYKINKNAWNPVTVLTNTANSTIWYPNSNLTNFNHFGPVFSFIYSQRPTTTNVTSVIDFAPVTLSAGQSYNFPMTALAQLDARVNCGGDLSPVIQWGDALARAALAVPRMDCVYQDIGLQSNGLYRVAINRGYDFLSNPFGITDQGQFMALPWPVGSNVISSLQPKFGAIHTAFGRRPYVITTNTQVVCDLPMPVLTDELLTPTGVSLTGDWLARASSDIAALYAVQYDDGSFPNEYNIHFLDDYFLSRVNQGLGQAYKGFSNSPAVQAQIATMMRRSLDRLMDVDLQTQINAPNVHFGYHPQWDFYCELPWDPLNPNFSGDYEGGFYRNTDRTESKCMVYWALYLYGKYIDTNYVRQPLIQERIRQMIKYQWINQDWNGDIWRNTLTGGQAAGSGDGWEEDLAIMLPRLAELAGLEQDWVNLSYRSAALKYGALLNFDHLSPPIPDGPGGWTTNYFSYPPPATALEAAVTETGWEKNEWGFVSLTPMHNSGTIYWQNDSGRAAWGSAWFAIGGIAGGGYGSWYTDNLLTNHIGFFDWQMYYVYEDYQDYPSTSMGFKMWMANNVYSAEARVHDPFLSAVKLMRARQIAETNSWVPYTLSMSNQNNEADILYNSSWYPADLAQIQLELVNRYPFMAGNLSVSNGAATSDFDHGPTYAWLTRTGAVVSVAAYRIFAPTNFTITLDGNKLGLPTNGTWQFTDIASGATNTGAAGQPLTVMVSPHNATTLRYSGPMVYGVQATPGNGMVNLSWNPVAGAASYNVNRATVSGGPFTTIHAGSGTTSFADTNAVNGTAYYYTVSAVVNGIQTASSFEERAIPDVAFTNAPVKFTGITAISGGAMDLKCSGTPGQTYVLRAATNLATPIVWRPILTNYAGTNGVFNFTDSQATNFAARFYRITTP